MSEAGGGQTMGEASGEQRAAQLLSEVPLLDGHNDLPWALRDAGCAGLDGTDLDQPVSFTHTDLPRLAAGGVGGQFWSVYVPATLAGEAAVAATLEQIDLVHRMISRYPGPARTRADRG